MAVSDKHHLIACNIQYNTTSYNIKLYHIYYMDVFDLEKVSITKINKYIIFKTIETKQR